MRKAVYGLATAAMLAGITTGCSGASPLKPTPIDAPTPMGISADGGGTAEPQDHHGFVHKIVQVVENYSSGGQGYVSGVEVVLSYGCPEPCSEFVNGSVDGTTDGRRGTTTLY